MKKLMIVLGVAAALTATAAEQVVLRDVHREGDDNDTLSYSYQTMELNPAISYKLVTTVKATVGAPGERSSKSVTFTNDVSEINATVTKTLSLSALFGVGAYPDGNIYLSLIGEDRTPVGTILDFMGATIPQGYLLCNGQMVSRTTYARLFAVIGTKYGTGDGSTTFALPNFNNRVSQGAGSYAVGTSIAPGIPNITGKVGTFRSFRNYTGQTRTGAFANSNSNGQSPGNRAGGGMVDDNYNGYVELNAATGEIHGSTYRNDVYGKSDTVQPAAIAVNKIIKY